MYSMYTAYIETILYIYSIYVDQMTVAGLQVDVVSARVAYS